MNVGGDMTVSNGKGDAAGVAGRTQIYNNLNTAARSVIGGNVTVSYLTGDGTTGEGIYDTQVLGSVAFHHGRGTFTTNFDGFRSSSAGTSP